MPKPGEWHSQTWTGNPASLPIFCMTLYVLYSGCWGWGKGYIVDPVKSTHGKSMSWYYLSCVCLRRQLRHLCQTQCSVLYALAPLPGEATQGVRCRCAYMAKWWHIWSDTAVSTEIALSKKSQWYSISQVLSGYRRSLTAHTLGPRNLNSCLFVLVIKA